MWDVDGFLAACPAPLLADWKAFSMMEDERTRPKTEADTQPQKFHHPRTLGPELARRARRP